MTTQESQPNSDGSKRALGRDPGQRLPRRAFGPGERGRLIAALAAVVAERGYAGLTAESVVVAAGLPSGSFYEHFASIEEAVAFAHEAIFERFLESIISACSGEEEWPLKVRAGIRAALRFAAARPEEARLLTLDPLDCGVVDMAKKILESSDRLSALLSTGRRHRAAWVDPPELTEKALVGAILALIAHQLIKGEPESLPELQPQLVELTLLPYLGASEAARVAGYPEIDG